MSKGQIVGIPVDAHNLTLAHHRVPGSSVVEHLTRSRRVVGSNPIWDSDFFRVYVSPSIYIMSCCCYFSVSKLFIDGHFSLSFIIQFLQG